MRIAIGFILLAVCFTACTGKQPKAVVTPRDTTITSSNAFSELFMDSAKVESFISSRKLEDSAANRLRNFYNSRNYQFAWFTEDGLAEQTLAFWNLHNNYIELSRDSLVVDKRLHDQMELFINEDSAINTRSSDIVETELQLTEHFFEYAQYAYAGKVDPEELQWHIPRKKVDAMALLDSLVANKGQHIEEWEPVNPMYKRLSKELKRYYDLDKGGGLQAISTGTEKNYKFGDSALTIKQVKQHLRALGNYDAADTSMAFTDEFTVAVKQAQRRFGHKQNGIIDTALINALNVPLMTRMEQMLINLERLRWMPREPAGNRLVVNIPDFKLHVFESSKKVFEMDIVVGTSANKTVIFNDVLKFVVLSPYWNVPRSIVRTEILPAMRRSSGYLARMNMEKTGVSNGLPVIRQKPGKNNALGRVKFLFPNNYNIYFHDTPSKSLFSRDKRAFSHGCIRLAEPKKLAEYLLRNQPEWTTDTIGKLMNASKETWVTLKEPVPVVINYLTAWISNDGTLNFREDVYGHDQKMAERLFNRKPVQYTLK